MKELLGRVPTISIPIFNGIQKFRLASSSIQVKEYVDPLKGGQQFGFRKI